MNAYRKGRGSLRKGIIWLILATILWSGNYIAGRILASQISPLTLNAIRWIISAILLRGMLRISRRRLLWTQWKEFLVLGFLGMFLFSSLTYLGLRLLPAAQAGMISGTMPVIILLASVVLLGERPSWTAWSGVGLSVLGVVFLVGGQSVGHLALSLGDVELLGAAVAWSLYTVLGKKFGRHLDPLTLTTGSAIFGAVLSTMAAGLAWQPHSVHLTGLGVAALLYVSTAASVVAYIIWTAGVERVGAGQSGPFLNLLPVWTVVLGLLLLHESVNLLELLGGGITILGAWLAGRVGSAPPPALSGDLSSSGPLKR